MKRAVSLLPVLLTIFACSVGIDSFLVFYAQTLDTTMPSFARSRPRASSSSLTISGALFARKKTRKPLR
jgi:hypothetical protein